MDRQLEDERQERRGRGEEIPMFARHLIGPAGQLPHQDLWAEVTHERRLALAASDVPSPSAPSGRPAPMMTLNRIVHAALVLLAPRVAGVLGTGISSRP
jgi:hypothetical protein